MTGELPTKTKINVELSEEDAKLFLVFQKNYETFKILKEANVFNVRNGKAILNFNHEGQLMEIDFHTLGYKRGKAVLHLVSFGV